MSMRAGNFLPPERNVSHAIRLAFSKLVFQEVFSILTCSQIKVIFFALLRNGNNIL